jgi:hypothetical protein
MPPPPPPGYGPPVQKGPAPSTVVNAVRLMFANAALSVLGIIVLLATKDALRKAVRDNNTSASDTRINDLVNAAITVGIVVAVVLIVLYVLLALQVRKGKNWARIVTWVFAGLGVLGNLSNLAQPGSTLTKVTAVIGLVIDIGIIVLLASSKSHPYFRKQQPQY